jgi:hypothetical protein
MNQIHHGKVIGKVIIIFIFLIVFMTCNMGIDDDDDNDGVQLIELSEVEALSDMSIPISLPPGVFQDAEEIPAISAVKRVLLAVYWQTEQINTAWLPRNQILEKILNALESLAASGILEKHSISNHCIISIIYELIEFINDQYPPCSDSSLWIPVVEATAVLERLIEEPSETVIYQGVPTSAGAILDIIIGDNDYSLEFHDVGVVELSPGYQIPWHQWFTAQRLGKAAVYGYSATVNSAPLTNGNKYDGFLVNMRFAYPQNTSCQKYAFIQFVNREETRVIDGTEVKSGGKWKIDVKIPEQIARNMNQDERNRWYKQHPCYQHQKTFEPTSNCPYPSVIMEDHPGLENSTLPTRKMSSIYRFKTYIVCCTPLNILGRIEWGFKLEYPGNGGSAVITQLDKDPDDDSKNLPRVETGAEEVINSLLSEWIADPNRDCSY